MMKALSSPPVTAVTVLEQPAGACAPAPAGAVCELPATPGRSWVLAQVRHSYSGTAGGQLLLEWAGGREEQYVGQFGQITYTPALLFPAGSAVKIILAGVGGGPAARLAVSAWLTG
jgi:hypothetical protein